MNYLTVIFTLTLTEKIFDGCFSHPTNSYAKKNHGLSGSVISASKIFMH